MTTHKVQDSSVDIETSSSSSSIPFGCPSYCQPTPDFFHAVPHDDCPFPSAGNDDRERVLKAKRKARPRANRRQFENKKFREILVIPFNGLSFAQAKKELLGRDGRNIKSITARHPSIVVTAIDSSLGFQVLVGARFLAAFKFAHEATMQLLQTKFPQASISVTPLGQRGLATLASYHLDAVLQEYAQSTPAPDSRNSYQPILDMDASCSIDPWDAGIETWASLDGSESGSLSTLRFSDVNSVQ